ncbi:MAG: hypothetical protein CME70_13315 [Halobacteriovorax sp.]|nr:hypothetical protein [Halobacteriovorax sp.]|tara:strand:- start:63788 stop:64180 length:393 start_codon:yes stop_codon:yes gene_type:complete
MFKKLVLNSIFALLFNMFGCGTVPRIFGKKYLQIPENLRRYNFPKSSSVHSANEMSKDFRRLYFYKVTLSEKFMYNQYTFGEGTKIIFFKNGKPYKLKINVPHIIQGKKIEKGTYCFIKNKIELESSCQL